jgi:hypothetical protein
MFIFPYIHPTYSNNTNIVFNNLAIPCPSSFNPKYNVSTKMCLDEQMFDTFFGSLNHNQSDSTKIHPLFQRLTRIYTNLSNPSSTQENAKTAVQPKNTLVSLSLLTNLSFILPFL